MATVKHYSEEIDGLLKSYLELLHEYTTLRTSLSSAQSSVWYSIYPTFFLNNSNIVWQITFSITKANTLGGAKYGQEQYDERPIQPMRTCRVTEDPEKGTAVVTISTASAGREQTGPVVLEENPDETSQAENGASSGNKESRTRKETKTAESAADTDGVGISNGAESAAGGGQDSQRNVNQEHGGRKETEAKVESKLKDSILMFGAFPSQVLRRIQTDAVIMVEDIIPKIVSVDLEMKAVEIKIRQARKKRSKAETQAKIQQDFQPQSRLGRGEALLTK